MNPRALGARLAVGALAAVVLAGCPTGESDPGPARAYRDVAAAAGQIAGTLGLTGAPSRFVPGWCGPTGRGRLRGTVVITLPRAASDAQARDDLAEHLRRLRRTGWWPDPGFRTHLPALQRDGIRVLFGVGGADARLIEVLGECA